MFAVRPYRFLVPMPCLLTSGAQLAVAQTGFATGPSPARNVFAVPARPASVAAL